MEETSSLKALRKRRFEQGLALSAIRKVGEGSRKSSHGLRSKIPHFKSTKSNKIEPFSVEKRGKEMNDGKRVAETGTRAQVPVIECIRKRGVEKTWTSLRNCSDSTSEFPRVVLSC